LLNPTAAGDALSFWLEAATTSAMISPAMSEQKMSRPLMVMRTAASPAGAIAIAYPERRWGKEAEIPQISRDFQVCAVAASQVCVQKTAVKHTQFSRLPFEGTLCVGRGITQIVKSKNGNSRNS
jgi:hypothetical protein